MRVSAATLPAGNEDWFSASPGLVVVLDGATARTGTGCRHGISWYAQHLGSALSDGGADRPLGAVLAAGIERVTAAHPQCDLAHPGTPSAAVGIVRLRDGSAEYLVLGDVSVVLETAAGISVVSDERVSRTATTERRAADAHPIGSPEKNLALVRMKQVELAWRNRAGGYWIAAADPAAARHALTGRIAMSDLRRFAVLTDGAARIVNPFGELSWGELLDAAEKEGPEAILHRVRAAERSDPDGVRWPRNKRSDDATLVSATVDA